MAKYIDADRLCAEIEKIYKSEIQPWLSGVSPKSVIYEYVLPLIDSLQKEQPEESVPNGLEEAAEKHLDTMFGRGKHQPFYKDLFIAGAKWQAEQLLKSSPLPEDTVLFNKGVAEGRRLMMEEAVNDRWDELQTNFREINEAFEAGKKEQMEQMLKGGIVILTEEDFEAEKEKSMEWGYNLCKEQMMKEAVEGEVMTNGFYPYEPRIVAPYPNCPYDFGDKVRVIVLPKQDKK